MRITNTNRNNKQNYCQLQLELPWRLGLFDFSINSYINIGVSPLTYSYLQFESENNSPPLSGTYVPRSERGAAPLFNPP